LPAPLRRLLRDAEGPDGTLSLVAFGAAVLFAGGLTVGASLNLAVADFADNIDPVALQAVNAINFDYPVRASSRTRTRNVAAGPVAGGR
jgi:hypothetical protein